MTGHPDLFAALASPFEPHEVKLRAAPGGKQLHYITARTAMNRLDDVLGPENWWDKYQPLENSVICSMTIRLPDGTTVTKEDAGGYAGMADQGDDDKSGYSDAFKRAAAKFGVARYLYRDGVPKFVRERSPVDQATRNLPEPQRREQGEDDDRPQQQRQPQGERRPNGQQSSQPRSGKAMFAWTKEMEQKYEIGLLKYLNGWAKLQEFPARMIDWDGDQVAAAYAEATRKIQSTSQGRPDDYEDAALAN